MKIRFLEPGNRPYKPTPLNYFVYDRYIRTPSVGLNTLATIVKELVDDTYMYSESISRIDMADVEDADIVFIGIFTFAAVRAHGRGLVVLGGLHASMNCAEAARHCDYVLLGEGDETIRAFVEAVGRGERPDFPGLAWMEGEELRSTGYPPPPERFETIADRNLVHNYSKMVGHSTLWPQVHASRGCPHNCDYCALVRHFGRRVRTRSPENVVADIRESIRFFHRGHVRLAKDLWLTDDNFFAGQVRGGLRRRDARSPQAGRLLRAGSGHRVSGRRLLRHLPQEEHPAGDHRRHPQHPRPRPQRPGAVHPGLRRPGGGRGRPAGRLRHPEPHPGHPDPVYVLRPRHADI